MEKKVIIFGAGPSGLIAGYYLTQSGISTEIYEAQGTIGGLSKTIKRGGMKFDLGGHRFFTQDKSLSKFIVKLMDGQMITVLRRSSFYYKNKYLPYPLKIFHVLKKVGLSESLNIICGYLFSRISFLFCHNKKDDLESWLIERFGPYLYKIIFKCYNEKILGLSCAKISKDWGQKRIEGLTLLKAIQEVFLRNIIKGKPRTLSDKFLYPRSGFGSICDKLGESIVDKSGRIFTNKTITAVYHSDNLIEKFEISDGVTSETKTGVEFISSIPLTELVLKLSPACPQEVLTAARRLHYRDLLTVNLVYSEGSITSEHWIYFPSKEIPFARIHEPKNWSIDMVEPGRNSLVVEYICSKEDSFWSKSDLEIIEITKECLCRQLKICDLERFIEGFVSRNAFAYPLYEVGYNMQLNLLFHYLKRFKNLYLVGRCGRFKYSNFDESVLNGIEAAENIAGARASIS